MANITRPNTTIRSRGTEPRPKYSHIPAEQQTSFQREGNGWHVPEAESDLGSVVVKRQVGVVNQKVQYPVRKHGQRDDERGLSNETPRGEQSVGEKRSG